MKKQTRFAFVAAGVLALLAAPRAGLAQTATIYGQLGNFDVVNNTGQDAHGFEIELEGLQPANVYYTFSAQRYGAPEILPSPLGTYVRWKSLYTVGTHIVPGSFDQTTIAHPLNAPFTAGTCYSWYPVTYNAAGCEHFGVSLTANAVRATYRWLIADPVTAGALAPVDPPVPVATPYYYVAPPVVANALPVVVIEVQAPEPPEVPGQYGDAQWMKVFVTQSATEVVLDQLVADNPLVVPMDPAQIETNWDVIQADPVPLHGTKTRSRKQTRGNLLPTTRSIVRRIEMYAYTGAYDPIDHRALCADTTCTAPGAGELGDFVSAQMTAVNVQADSVNVVKVGNGNVESADKKITCGSKCVSPFIGGTAVTLTAKAGSGSVFSAWTGACSGNSPTCTVTATGHVDVAATFATATTGGCGGGGGTGGTQSFTLSIGRSNVGTVTSDLTGINCGNACSAKFASGAVVTLTAAPAGKTFANWAGACSGTALTCAVTITKDTSVQAVFNK